MIKVNEEYFWELQRTLSAEFSKYVLAHPEINDQIPDNAQIVFQLKGNRDFNSWSKKTGLAQKEPKQAVVIISVDALAPPLESRLVNPRIKLATK